MRWALLFLTIALCLILDQYKYRGHYREYGVERAGQVVASVKSMSWN
jgi:hypothetical protein